MKDIIEYGDHRWVFDKEDRFCYRHYIKYKGEEYIEITTIGDSNETEKTILNKKEEYYKTLNKKEIKKNISRVDILDI